MHDGWLGDGESYYVFSVDDSVKGDLEKQLADLPGWKEADGTFHMPIDNSGLNIQDKAPDGAKGWQFFLGGNEPTSSPTNEPVAYGNYTMAFWDTEGMKLYIYECDS